MGARRRGPDVRHGHHKLQKQLRNGAGQCRQPGLSRFAGVEGEKKLKLGGLFGATGWQMSKVIGGRRFWRIPVMDGEFVRQSDGPHKKVVGGGMNPARPFASRRALGVRTR